MNVLRFCLSILLLFKLTVLNAVSILSSNLPLILIDTKGYTIVDEPKVYAVMQIIDNGLGKINNITDVPVFKGPIGIEYRGSYSQLFPQKSYGFETRDNLGNSKNVSLLGLPEENDWILLQHYNDKSFVRNTLSYKLFREMGHYASRAIFCEVLVNNQYMGIFTLIEKIKCDKNRVNIAKMSKTDNSGINITGGYIFKIDNIDKSDTWWASNYAPTGYSAGSVKFIYYYPNAEDITADQKNYLKTYINGFESVIFGNSYTDPNNGYAKYIDVGSFVDYFLMGEFSRNIDAYKKSCYYFKDFISDGGLIHAGPIWDFDWAYKNFKGCFENNLNGSGWAYKIFDCRPNPVPPAWMTRLISDESFANNCHDRYFQLRKTVFSETGINAYIDSIANLLNEPQKRHYALYDILGKKPGVNILGTPEIDFYPSTYQGEVSKLKTWISLRLAFLDKNMIGRPTATGLINQTQQTKWAFRMFPNPCSDALYVESVNELAEIEIFGIDGKLHLWKTNINNHVSFFNIRNLEKSIYLVKIRYKSGEVSNAKLIVE